MMNIFVGTSIGKDDFQAERVLEYSLRKNTNEPMDITWMRNIPGTPHGGFDSDEWWTPFSYLRWTVPEAMGFKGRALYMDVDQVNFRNIAELYHMDLAGRAAAIRQKDARTCVMVMDCERMQDVVPSIDEVRKDPGGWHEKLQMSIRDHAVPYDDRWNCLDGEDRDAHDIWHLHFTRMETQPWKPKWPHETYAAHEKKFTPRAHERADLVYIWEHLLNEAEAAWRQAKEQEEQS